MSERCVVYYMLHVMPLIISLIQAAEKSLSLLRSSPERVTANLASGTFPPFCDYPEYAPEKGGGASALQFDCLLAQTSIVVSPVVRLLHCKMIPFRYVCERF